MNTIHTEIRRAARGGGVGLRPNLLVRVRIWLSTAAVAAVSSALLLTFTGCASPVGPDEAAGRTPAGISVEGAGPERFPAIDADWEAVNRCWGVQVDGGRVTVTVQAPELTDEKGLGVIRFGGRLVYGARVGDHVYVASDLAALRHELSHLVGEEALGRRVGNGEGRCWV